MTIRVFLADDHAVVRDGLRLLLETQPDIDVVGEAANGREAVLKAQLQCPDVLVMDIVMSDLNGIEATRKTRALCPSTQVVILSMHSTAEHIARAFQAGALGYVLKESAGMDVVKAVRAVHSGSRYVSQKLAETGVYDLAQQHQGGSASPLERLSEREREVLQLIVEGRTSAQIAGILALSPKTIETYRSRLMHKLGLSGLPSLVKFAIQHGLTPLE
jgi:DNA-binding NarL/FixJ family response regulator